jgi:twitching motility protein PilT
MRDLDTVETALMAAETGHLVIATLHTPDAAQTLQRIASVFPQQQQESIAYQLAGSLQGVISQRLLPRATGSARVLAVEICIANTAVRNMIREGNVHQLRNEIMTGRKHKMQLMDNVLLDLYQRGEITYDVAVSNCHDGDFIAQRTKRATEGRG